MQFQIRHLLVSLVLVGALILAGCTNSPPASTPTPTSAATSSPVSAATTSSPVSTAGETTSAPETNNSLNPQMKNLPTLQGKATVVMTVKGSPITIEVDGTNAPVTAGNFVDLVQRGVYDGLVFHRVEKDPQPFVVQGGDPQTKDKNFSGRAGTGSFVDPKTGTPRYIPLEIKTKGAAEPVYSKTVAQAPVLTHKRGAVAMARSMQPDSASSQFYFALSDLPFLDGNYAVFGYVTGGMDVVDKIQIGDRIESAKITEGADNLKAAAE